MRQRDALVLLSQRRGPFHQPTLEAFVPAPVLSGLVATGLLSQNFPLVEVVEKLDGAPFLFEVDSSLLEEALGSLDPAVINTALLASESHPSLKARLLWRLHILSGFSPQGAEALHDLAELSLAHPEVEPSLGALARARRAALSSLQGEDMVVACAEAVASFGPGFPYEEFQNLQQIFLSLGRGDLFLEALVDKSADPALRAHVGRTYLESGRPLLARAATSGVGGEALEVEAFSAEVLEDWEAAAKAYLLLSESSPDGAWQILAARAAQNYDVTRALELLRPVNENFPASRLVEIRRCELQLGLPPSVDVFDPALSVLATQEGVERDLVLVQCDTLWAQDRSEAFSRVSGATNRLDLWGTAFEMALLERSLQWLSLVAEQAPEGSTKSSAQVVRYAWAKDLVSVESMVTSDPSLAPLAANELFMQGLGSEAIELLRKHRTSGSEFLLVEMLVAKGNLRQARLELLTLMEGTLLTPEEQLHAGRLLLDAWGSKHHERESKALARALAATRGLRQASDFWRQGLRTLASGPFKEGFQRTLVLMLSDPFSEGVAEEFIPASMLTPLEATLHQAALCNQADIFKEMLQSMFPEVDFSSEEVHALALTPGGARKALRSLER